MKEERRERLVWRVSIERESERIERKEKVKEIVISVLPSKSAI